MKKIFSFLVILCLMSMSIMAQPQVPYILYGTVEWNSQLLSGARIEITNLRTLVAEITQTDGNGLWTYNMQGYATNDQVQVKVLDGCGTVDTCTKIVTINSAYAVVNFDVTGTMASCPQVVCPSSSGGGGGSCFYSQQVCESKYPCDSCPVCAACPSSVCDECPEPVVCPECPAVEQPICPEEQECPECEKPNEVVINLVWGLFSILIALAGAVAGGYYWFPGMKGIANKYMTEAMDALRKGDYETAKKKSETAFKTMKTIGEKAKEGQYY